MNKIKEVMKSEVEDPKKYLGFMDKKNTKGRRFARKVALTASLATAFLSAGCATNQNTLPTTTIEVPVTLPPKPTETIIVTPEVTPIPTETPAPIPTPAYVRTCVLECPEDALDGDKVAQILKELKEYYLSTSFAYRQDGADLYITKNCIMWQAIPEGKIDEENLIATIEGLHEIERLEDQPYVVATSSNKPISGSFTINSIESTFIENSEAQKVYRELREIKYILFKTVGTPEGVIKAEEIANYISENYVFDNPNADNNARYKDKLFGRLENETGYDKLKILYQIDHLISIIWLYIPNYEPVINGIKIDTDTYLENVCTKYDKYWNEFANEVIGNSKNLKNSLSHN